MQLKLSGTGKSEGEFPPSEFFQTGIHLEKPDGKQHYSAIEVWGRTEEESRSRAMEIVDAVNEKHKRDKLSSTELTFQSLSRFVNGTAQSGYNELADEITNDHRTLQQCMFGLFMSCIARWNKAKLINNYDGRNEFTVKASHKIVELLDYDRIEKERTSAFALSDVPSVFIDGEPSVPFI